MAPTPSEADIIFNKANVALAKSQRLLASWLPPRKPEEPQNTKTEEELDREEQEMFVPMPETLGMGATVPKDGKVRREELSSNDKLRKQLLGKDHEKKMGKRKREDGQVRLGSVLIGSKPRPTPSERQVEEDSEDEPGRSALGKSRHISKEKLAHQSMVGTEDATRQLKEPEQEPLAELSRPHKRTSNYLDEVLADRSRRKHKKANRKAGMAI